MKILQLKVRNFAPIMVAMKRPELYIDFRKNDNLLTLVIGRNGSGKTTIISLLHPFAYNGDIDNRKRDLIMEKMNGYKYISIEDGDDVYDIEHHYNRNNDDSITLKSFFRKNGDELNENGNVTSFKSLVETYLGIDESFIKLLRLGSNVSNIINMSNAERKEFMAKRLEELDMYNKFYKKTSEDLRTIKALLKTNINKINSLNILDIDEFIKLCNIDEAREKDLLNQLRQLSTSLAVTKDRLNNIAPDGVMDFKERYESMYNQLISLKSIVDTLSNKISKDDSNISLKDLIDKCNIEETLLIAEYDKINTIRNKIYTLNTLLESTKTTEYIDNLDIQKSSLEEKISKFVKNYGKVNPELNSSKLKDALSRLQYIDDRNHHLMNKDSKLISKIMKDSNGKLETYLDTIRFEVAQLSIDIVDKNKLKDILKTNVNKLYVITEPNCGITKCSYRKFYNDMNDFNTGTSIEGDIEEYSELVTITEMLIELKETFNQFEDYKKFIPKNPYDFEYVVSRLIKNQSLFDFKYISDFIIMADEWEEYEKNVESYNGIVESLNTLKNDKSDEYRKEVELLSKELVILEEDYKAHKEKVDNYKITITNKINMQDIINEHMSKSKDYEILLEKYNSMIGKNEEISELLKEEVRDTQSYKLVMREVNILQENNARNKMKIIQYKDLVEEKNKLTKDYDDFEAVVSAITPKQGIPLEFMNFYLETIKLNMNECLKVVYGDTLEIVSMEATDKSFDIIYAKDGVIAGDISSASQGESSFISIALSFAFLKQSIKDFNILILDELDGALDYRYRQKFLDILYDTLRDIRCTQCFIITHNELYNDQYVDLLITDDSDVQKFVNGKIIYKNASS